MGENTRVRAVREERICQGDILAQVDYIEYLIEREGVVDYSWITFPWAVVLTQDCDLMWDSEARAQRASTQDKLLISALVAPLYIADHVFKGEHLSELDFENSKQAAKPKMKMQDMSDGSKTAMKIIMDNRNPRYHYLEFPEATKLPALIVDFKHYFSVNLDYLLRTKQAKWVTCISELYREDVSQRFANFLSRIGLPNEKPGGTKGSL